MGRRLFLGALAGAFVGLTAGLAAAQPHIALPPVNLGQTSFLDGQGGPGLMTHAPVDLYEAPRSAGAGGQTLPGSTQLIANAYWEFAVENRPVDARLNVAALRVW